MTVKLGMFTMPFHPPRPRLRRPAGRGSGGDRPGGPARIQRGVRRRAFQLPRASRITSPLIFLATLLAGTGRITLRHRRLNAPMHPATVAAQAAMFDHLAAGRFIMGIGPGGLVSDSRVFDSGRPSCGPRWCSSRSTSPEALVRGSALPHRRPVLEDLAREPPGPSSRWALPRPYQQPHPPIALSLLTPNSASAWTAGERGWIPISGHSSTGATCAATGSAMSRDARRSAAGPTQRLACLAQRARHRDRRGGRRLSGRSRERPRSTTTSSSISFARGRKALFMLKPDPEVADEG